MCKIGEHFCREDERYIMDALRGPSRLKEIETAIGTTLTTAATTTTTEEENEGDLEPSISVNPFDYIYKMNFDRTEGRTIFLSRHGESEYNLTARIGGNPPLTTKGQRYAKALGVYINSLGNYLHKVTREILGTTFAVIQPLEKSQN